MNKALGVAVGIIMIAIAFVVFPIIMDASDSILAPEKTQVITVPTASGVTTATLTLTDGVYENDKGNVTLSSSNANDTPVVSSASGKSVVVTGLEASSTRIMNVTYASDALDNYTGLAAIVKVAPLIVFVSILGVAIGGAYFSFKKN